MFVILQMRLYGALAIACLGFVLHKPDGLASFRGQMDSMYCFGTTNWRYGTRAGFVWTAHGLPTRCFQVTLIDRANLVA